MFDVSWPSPYILEHAHLGSISLLDSKQAFGHWLRTACRHTLLAQACRRRRDMEGNPWLICITTTTKLLRGKASEWPPSDRALLRVVLAGAIRDEYR